MWPCQDSNLDLKFRKLPFYPLNYRAVKTASGCLKDLTVPDLVRSQNFSANTKLAERHLFYKFQNMHFPKYIISQISRSDVLSIISCPSLICSKRAFPENR